MPTSVRKAFLRTKSRRVLQSPVDIRRSGYEPRVKFTALVQKRSLDTWREMVKHQGRQPASFPAISATSWEVPCAPRVVPLHCLPPLGYAAPGHRDTGG